MIEDVSTATKCFEKYENFLSSLRCASRLQKGLLPKQRHFDRIFEESFIIYIPQQIVSGDFYWVSKNEHLIYVAVGDCTGHGVPGAMLSTLAYSLLSYIILNKGVKKTNKILQELDKKFIESFSPEFTEENYDNDWLEISLCCIDTQKKVIYFSGANRKLLHVSKKNKCAILYKGSPYPIGGWQMENERTFESHSISYSTGDCIYLGSDGYQDQKGGPDGKKFCSSNLHKLLYSISNKPLKEQKEILENTLVEWKGNYPQTDDICLIGIRL